MNSFYSIEELHNLGFKSVGKNVLISKKCSIYSPERISIGDNVRIDDFCILSGEIKLGSHIHISAYAALYGANGIEMENYTGVSPRTTIFSAMDDFSGDYLIGPIHPKEYINVTGGNVILRQFSQLGAGTIVFPNIDIGEGAVTGAMSLVNKDLTPWTINVGIPVHVLKKRRNDLKCLIKSNL
ncbi:MAG: hypothetical protein IJZ71_01175 [Treponema sp.]|nr:hypothetical protein [Treponema sp.]